MKIKYTVRSDIVTDDEGNVHTVYGFNVFEGGKIIRVLPDLFTDKDTAYRYAGLFCRYGMPVAQLDEVLEEII